MAKVILRTLQVISAIIAIAMILIFIVGPFVFSVLGLGVFGLVAYLAILVQPETVGGIIITLFFWLLVGLGIRHEKKKHKVREEQKLIEKTWIAMGRPIYR